MQYFLFPFYENGATCNILLCPKCYIGMYLTDMVGNLDFLNQFFSSKNYPYPKKLKPWQVCEKCSNKFHFVECARHQAFIKTHAYSHNFRIFQATGFQNIGTLNAISHVILGANGKNGNTIGSNGTNVTNQWCHWKNPEPTQCLVRVMNCD